MASASLLDGRRQHRQLLAPSGGAGAGGEVPEHGPAQPRLDLVPGADLRVERLGEERGADREEDAEPDSERRVPARMRRYLRRVARRLHDHGAEVRQHLRGGELLVPRGQRAVQRRADPSRRFQVLHLTLEIASRAGDGSTLDLGPVLRVGLCVRRREANGLGRVRVSDGEREDVGVAVRGDVRPAEEARGRLAREPLSPDHAARHRRQPRDPLLRRSCACGVGRLADPWRDGGGARTADHDVGGRVVPGRLALGDQEGADRRRDQDDRDEQPAAPQNAEIAAERRLRVGSTIVSARRI